MNRLEQRQLLEILVKCNKCGGTLVENYELKDINGFTVRNFNYLECVDCGEKYSGYEYEIANNMIINFKLLK